jgi:hypothetical protein
MRQLARFLILFCLATAPLAACGSTASSSGPLGPCGDDARGQGAYPELERLLPSNLDGRPPDHVDSGRSCSAKALGSFVSHGIGELRFAGATWGEGGSNATAIAVLATPREQPLPQEGWVEEFYETGARASSKAENIETSRPTMPDVGEVWRLETLNDLSLQTVIVWDDRGLIHVVIVGTEVNPNASREIHERRVQLAVLTSAHAPGDG